MKKELSCLLWMCVLGLTAQAIVIDDFSGGLSGWSSTVILDNNGGAFNTAAWQVTDEKLQLNTTVYDGIQQYAMIRSGLSLGIGQELQMSVVHSSASQDIGLYVGGTAPTTGVRADYISVYARNTGELFTRGFDGSTEYGQIGWISPAYTKLFIARTAVNTFETGYYDAEGRHIMATRTPGTANNAAYCGLYADVREAGVLGDVDTIELWSSLWAPHSPAPASGNPAAGVALGNGTVDVTLDWQAGLDPLDESQVNPAITKHLVFLSGPPADPNLYYLGAVSQPQPDTDAAATFGTVSGLSEVTAYRWAVVEALAGYDEQTFVENVSTLDQVDPNNIIGPTWTFTTSVGVDRTLVAEYLFENNLDDTSGEDNHGNASDPNAPTFDNADSLNGSSGYYAVLDGTGQWIDFGTAAYPKAGDFPYGVGGGLEEGTITCWIKPTQAGGLLSNYNDGTTTGFALSLAVNGAQIDARMNARGESGDVATVQGRPGKTDFDLIGDGQWHMVAATWKWGETMNIYVDGGQVASVAAGTPTEFAPWQYGVLFGATRSGTDRTVLQNLYGGLLDNLRVYNYVLDGGAIASEYYSTTGNLACTDPDFAGSAYNLDNSGSSYCRVDLADFALIAENWLSSGLSAGE